MNLGRQFKKTQTRGKLGENEFFNLFIIIIINYYYLFLYIYVRVREIRGTKREQRFLKKFKKG